MVEQAANPPLMDIHTRTGSIVVGNSILDPGSGSVLKTGG